jgi:hypothetical protein
MANPCLLYSSVFFGILLLYFCYKYNSKENMVLIVITLLGVCTSIVNHMYTHKVFRYIDRTTMIMGMIIIFIISMHNKMILPIVGIILSSFLYIFSKYVKNTVYHLFAHLTITITIIFLLHHYSIN